MQETIKERKRKVISSLGRSFIKNNGTIPHTNEGKSPSHAESSKQMKNSKVTFFSTTQLDFKPPK